MTVEVYEHLIPSSNRGAVNQLDSPQPSATCQNRKVVTSKDYDLFSLMVPKAGFEPARP